MYAIVDIETTGGNASTGSITEIAIVITGAASAQNICCPQCEFRLLFCSTPVVSTWTCTAK